MLCLPQPDMSVYYYIISCFFNMPERIYTDYGKDLLQSIHMSWSHVAGSGRAPSGAARQDLSSQGWSLHPSQKQGRMGGTGGSWGSHICPLFTVGTSRTHGRAQATELSSVHSLVGHRQLCDPHLPNASPQPKYDQHCHLEIPGTIFPPLCFQHDHF